MAKFTIEVEPVADDSELRRQFAEARDEVTSARAENERLRGELATRTKRLIVANHDRETMVTALARANKRIEDLETREQHGADSAYAQRATVDRLARELDAAKAERDATRAERRAYEAECELLRKENCNLRDDVEGAVGERDKARALVNDWRGRADRLEAALNEALAERDEAREAQATLNTEITTLTRDRNEALGSACSKTDIIVSLRKQLAMRPLPAGTLGAELAALRARVAELEKTLAKTEKQRDENHASAHEWRSFFDTAIEERDAARIEVITAKNKLTDARAALDRLI